MGFTAAKCPVCGADIQVDGEISNCFCMYCGSQIHVQNAINGVAIDGVASANAILTRANQFLQTSNFEKANEYFLRVLDLEPTNSQAFLGQLLATIQCSNASNVKVYVEDYSQYKFAHQYADEALQEELRNLADSARKRFTQEMNEAALTPNSVSISCGTAYNFLWTPDEKPQDSDFEKIKIRLCNPRRFDAVVYPAVAFYDCDCTTIMDVLLALEYAVSNKYKIILFVHSCDEELLRTLLMNCMRGILQCELVCINDVNKLREAALFCGTSFNSETVPNIQKAYIVNNNLVLVK